MHNVTIHINETNITRAFRLCFQSITPFRPVRFNDLRSASFARELSGLAERAIGLISLPVLWCLPVWLRR